mgnify:CR=1 FL=1
MTRIVFAWYGTKKIHDAGCKTTRSGGFIKNFDNGWKEQTAYHFSDGSGNALRLKWENISHMKIEPKGSRLNDLQEGWEPFNSHKLDAILSNGEEWWKTSDELEHRNGTMFVTRDHFDENALMIGMEKV